MPSVLATRQVVTHEQFRSVAASGRVAADKAYSATMRRACCLYGWMLVSLLIVGVALTVVGELQQSSIIFAGPTSMTATLVISLAIYFAVHVCGNRAGRAARLVAVKRELVRMSEYTGGRVCMALCDEAVTRVLQEEGSARVPIVSPGSIVYVRASIPQSEAALHPEMTQATHRFEEKGPLLLPGDNGVPLPVPAPPPGCVYVSPHDYMSPVYVAADGAWSTLSPLQAAVAAP